VILRRAIRRLLRWVSVENEAEVLRKSLRHCGRGVAFRFPCIIELPDRVSIGDDVSIASFLHIWGNGSVTIGDRVMIASHVAITSATHDPESEEMIKTLIEAPVVIENDVWIGAHAVIFPGVTIGHQSVVAAGSVVRADVPPYSIVAGVPARLVRSKKPANTFSSHEKS